MRQDAARSLPALVERAAGAFESELLDIVLHLAAADDVGDRAAAAYALSKMPRTPDWNRDHIMKALASLHEDASYLMRLKIVSEP